MKKPDKRTTESIKDLPPMVISLGLMGENRTGSWRNLRPVFEDKLPPCNTACPAGNDIRGFLKLITQGKPLEAWKFIKETSPLPGVCGRVCPHPCEKSCNRSQFDNALSIHALERLAADSALHEKVEPPGVSLKTQRVAIIGSGPAALSAAYFLARDGYPVTVFEAMPEIGGMLRAGIPEYRLPRNILDKEIADIKALGVAFATSALIEDVRKLKEYAAVVVAVGAHRSHKLNIAGEDSEGVISGTEFLSKLNSGKECRIGKKVIVVGGGNTAIDAARSVRRLGAESTVVYRRTDTEMPAIKEEVADAIEEGVRMVFLATPVKIATDKNGNNAVQFIRMMLGEPDEKGRRRPEPVKGSEFKMEADLVIIAIGEEADLSFLPTGVKLSESGINIGGMRLYGSGDAVTGAGTVAAAIGSGRRVARAVIGDLQKQVVEPETSRGSVPFDDINTAYFSHQPTIKFTKLPMKERLSGFVEVNRGITLTEGIEESGRCFSCGACRQCDNCFIFCPDLAIKKKNGDYEINLDYCKGCGVCCEECPVGRITLVEEER